MPRTALPTELRQGRETVAVVVERSAARDIEIALENAGELRGIVRFGIEVRRPGGREEDWEVLCAAEHDASLPSRKKVPRPRLQRIGRLGDVEARVFVDPGQEQEVGLSVEDREAHDWRPEDPQSPAFDNATVTFVDDVSNLFVGHASAGEDRALVAQISSRGALPSSVTFDGDPMDKELTQGGTSSNAETWVTTDQPTGSANLNVQYPSNVDVVVGIQSFSSVHQEEPVRQALAATTRTIDLDQATGDDMLAGFCAQTAFDSGSVGNVTEADQVSRWTPAAGGAWPSRGSTRPGSSGTTMGYGGSASSVHHQAVALQTADDSVSAPLEGPAELDVEALPLTVDNRGKIEANLEGALKVDFEALPLGVENLGKIEAGLEAAAELAFEALTIGAENLPPVEAGLAQALSMSFEALPIADVEVLPSLQSLADRSVDLWVRVEDAEGEFQDVAELLGEDWLDGVEVTASQEAFCARATVYLHREVPNPEGLGTLTLAPLIEDWIEPGRRVEIDAGVGYLGEDVVEVIPLFRGEIDDIEAGGDEGVIEVPCRDRSRALHDAWITAEDTYGSDASPVPIQTVMQQLLDDRLGARAPTIHVEGDPDFGVVAYEQRAQSLEQALKALTNLIGWDLRQVRDGDDFRLTLREPPDPEEPDWTFDADDYFGLEEVALDTEAVRNRVEVIGTDTGGNRAFVAVENEESIAALASASFDGRMTMRLDAQNNPTLIGAAALNRLAEAALRDTALPPLTHTAEHDFFPWAEVGQKLRYEPNAVHYDEAQDVFVVGVTHRLFGGAYTTTIQARSRPTGGRIRWIRMAQDSARRQEDADLGPAGPEPLSGTAAIVIDTASGNVSGILSGTPRVRSWKVAAAIGERPTDGDIEAGAVHDGQTVGTDEIGTLLTAEPGDVVFLAARPYAGLDGDGEEGPRVESAQTYGVGADGQIASGTMIWEHMRQGLKQFTSNIVFSSSSRFVVSWSGGSLRTADGVTTTISSGSTGTMSAGSRYFIYFDGTGTLKVTTNFAIASDNNIIVATAWPGPDALSTQASWYAAVGILGGGSLTNFDRVGANAIRAGNIQSISLSVLQATVDDLAAINGTFSGVLTAATARATGAFEVEAGQGLWLARLDLSAGDNAGRLRLRNSTGAQELVLFQTSLGGQLIGDQGLILGASGGDVTANLGVGREFRVQVGGPLGSTPLRIDSPPNTSPHSASAILVVNNGGSLTSRRVRVGADDSAASGFAQLMVANP